MNAPDAERVVVELTTAEANLIITALRRFEPYWPSDLADVARADVLAEIRQAVDHVTGSLEALV